MVQYLRLVEALVAEPVVAEQSLMAVDRLAAGRVAAYCLGLLLRFSQLLLEHNLALCVPSSTAIHSEAHRMSDAEAGRCADIWREKDASPSM